MTYGIENTLLLWSLSQMSDVSHIALDEKQNKTTKNLEQLLTLLT